MEFKRNNIKNMLNKINIIVSIICITILGSAIYFGFTKDPTLGILLGIISGALFGIMYLVNSSIDTNIIINQLKNTETNVELFLIENTPKNVSVLKLLNNDSKYEYLGLLFDLNNDSFEEFLSGSICECENETYSIETILKTKNVDISHNWLIYQKLT